MARARNSRGSEFLRAYHPDEVYLLKPARARGAPGIIEGSSASGDPLLIRVWPRSGKIEDKDLVEIWRNELRLLHRLGGAPGAEEHIAHLLDAGEDPKGFYIVIAAGQRRPLAVLIEKGRGGAEWLRSTSSPVNRRRLWANLKRVALGLEVLHSQGLIHCNLDTWSILTTGDVEPDFQLTGFEWSMRIMAAGDQRGAKAPLFEHAVSFLDDWSAFARLAAGLMGAKLERLADFKIPHYDVAESLVANEASLLRELLAPAPHVQLDAEYVTRRIDLIIDALEIAATAEEPQHQLILGLGRDSGLTRAIREASDLTVDLEDAAAQLEFVKGDLLRARVLAVGKPDDFSMVLKGVELAYRLRPYAIKNSPQPTWEFAVCDRAELARDFGAPVVAEDDLPPGSLRLMTFGEANQRAPRIRGRVLHWEALRKKLTAAAPRPQNREQRFLRALTLLHAVDLVAAAAEAFPVTARADIATGEDGGRIELSLAADPDREKLAETLTLRPLNERLQQLLEREVTDEEGWLLAENRTLGRRSVGDIDLQYERTVSNDQETRFLFRPMSHSATMPSNAILVPGEFRGRLSQFRRRANALRALQGHAELLRMLSDPRGSLWDSHETLTEDAHLARLDPAKRDAFRELGAVLPLYLVQGPPGVGKTFLVREVVRRRFAEESTARLLLTAQSHHAVDHLMLQVRKDWGGASGEPLAVRCRAPSERDPPGPLDLHKKSDEVLLGLAASNLAKSSSPHLASRLSEMVRKAEPGQETSRRAERRLVEGLVMRSANVVFATTNSGDLERLLEERAQFDWAIVEEAGKATGVELLMPLLLSYRRLMIGDHKQLPPFGAERLDALLANPSQLRKAMGLGLELVERSLKDVIPDDLQDLLDSEDNEDAFAQLCAEARRALFLFESIVEREIGRQKQPGARGRPIARKLDIQHRMHPAIAGLVSRCFYNNELHTSEASAAEFNSAASPIRTRNADLVPDKPIVIVNMPYQPATRGLGEVEAYPRYSNEDEVAAVCRLIAMLQAQPSDGDRPSLAVLSPYARQVERLRTKLLDDERALKSLSGFDPVARNGAWCSTVDAFQGNEADAIVVSLVRNNHHSTPRRALGFISDPRRMNVLLSRAKWRLYIVTSLDFLKTVTSPLGREQTEEGGFLREMLTGLEEALESGAAGEVDWRKLMEHSQ